MRFPPFLHGYGSRYWTCSRCMVAGIQRGMSLCKSPTSWFNLCRQECRKSQSLIKSLFHICTIIALQYCHHKQVVGNTNGTKRRRIAYADDVPKVMEYFYFRAEFPKYCTETIDQPQEKCKCGDMYPTTFWYHSIAYIKLHTLSKSPIATTTRWR